MSMCPPRLTARGKTQCILQKQVAVDAHSILKWVDLEGGKRGREKGKKEEAQSIG
jgi:hypothetical protein